jgi:hypothetical protein
MYSLIPMFSPFRKNISSSRQTQITSHIYRRLVPHEGWLAIVTDAGRDAVDAGVADNERR